MAREGPIKVLVTGFGPFLDVTKNPSFEIVSRLPSKLCYGGNGYGYGYCRGHGGGHGGGDGDGGDGDGGDVSAVIVAHPEPLPAVYHALLDASAALLDRHDPDLVLHIGLAADRAHFALERGAPRDGYHQVPDMDRRVLLRAEGRDIWGRRSAEALASGLDLDRALDRWRARLRQNQSWNPGNTGASSFSSFPSSSKQKATGKKRGAGGGATPATAVTSSADIPDVRVSDDVGTYVCGLLYYATLANLDKRGKSGRPAVFFHVPPLPRDEDVQRGVAVTTALIEALVEVYQE